ncbi:MAG: hypothetical protein IBJ14_16185 [Hydrogenophaga sp.]|nr:hypothetical protein [Hydrogenophaga sp.]
MQEVKLPPYVKRRGNVYWFRRRVPDDLIPLVGRGEFMESLKTTELDVARTRAAYRNAEVEAVFEKARYDLKRQSGTVLTDDPTPEQQQYIRDAVRFHLLDEDESVRLSRPGEDNLDSYDDYRSNEYDTVAEGLRTGRVAWGAHEKAKMGKLLAAVGVQVEPGTPAWDVAAYRASEGLHAALRDIAKRSSEDHVPTPMRPVLPASLTPVAPVEAVAETSARTLGDVIDHYTEGLPDNEFRRKVVRCLLLFGEMVGRSTPVAELRQMAVTNFMRDICRLPDKWARRFDAGESIATMLAVAPDKVMSPSTYEANYRGPLGTFLAVAARDFGDDGFRTLSVKHIKYTGDRVPEEDQQRPLTDAELVTLFEGEEFRRIAADPGQEALYWLLVVMLFTGARPRELCQLNPQVDFGAMEGHCYIDLDEKTAAGVGVKKSIKTGETRRLPLHAELVRLGFPEYLQRVKDAGGDRLFPSWRVKQGNPFSAHYERVAGFLKVVGLYTRTAPPGELVTGAYVLRKTFITQCRNQGVVSKEITGHSDGLTTAMQDRHYVKGPEPLRRKREQLAKLVMPVAIPKRAAQASP